MKLKTLAFIPFVLLSVAGVAHAETAVSETRAPELKRLYVGDEMLGLKPAIGIHNYTNDVGGDSTRAAYGIAIDLNLASAIGLDFTRWFAGVQTGATYSHLGPSSANFFGADGSGANGGANLFLIPVNLKAGFAPFSWMRAGVHGGGNVIYRSIASAIVLDTTSLNWRLVPNVGADVDFSVSKNVSVSLRPDWTLSSVQNLFSATAVVGVALN